MELVFLNYRGIRCHAKVVGEDEITKGMIFEGRDRTYDYYYVKQPTPRHNPFGYVAVQKRPLVIEITPDNKPCKKNGYEKTGYEMMVEMTTNAGIYRQVWKKDGKFYVSYREELCDVTFAAESHKWK